MVIVVWCHQFPLCAQLGPDPVALEIQWYVIDFSHFLCPADGVTDTQEEINQDRNASS